MPFFKEKNYATVIEYIILLSVVAVMVTMLMPNLRTNMQSWFDNMTSNVASSINISTDVSQTQPAQSVQPQSSASVETSKTTNVQQNLVSTPSSSSFDLFAFLRGVVIAIFSIIMIALIGLISYGWFLSSKLKHFLDDFKKDVSRLILSIDKFSYDVDSDAIYSELSNELFGLQRELNKTKLNPVNAYYAKDIISRFDEKISSLESKIRKHETRIAKKA